MPVAGESLVGKTCCCGAQVPLGTSRADKRKSFFTEHRVNLWNSLPQDVAMATNGDAFKRGLDKLMEEEMISGY